MIGRIATTCGFGRRWLACSLPVPTTSDLELSSRFGNIEKLWSAAPRLRTQPGTNRLAGAVSCSRTRLHHIPQPHFRDIFPPTPFLLSRVRGHPHGPERSEPGRPYGVPRQAAWHYKLPDGRHSHEVAHQPPQLRQDPHAESLSGDRLGLLWHAGPTRIRLRSGPASGSVADPHEVRRC